MICPALLAAQGSHQLPEKDFERLRKEMVSKQLITRDITDTSVLKAMSTVPRHLFVPPGVRSLSYQDSALHIGYSIRSPSSLMLRIIT
jgi:protein-L-isoaspartate(D-aspartate) O-methyltransferase